MMRLPETEVSVGARGGRLDGDDGVDNLILRVRARRMSTELFGTASEDAAVDLGRFRLLDVVGAGAAGVVFRAQDRELGRAVAVKVMRCTGEDGRARLRRETQALAALAHPNVVQIYDVGEHEGQLWVAMEFVEGCTLREWLETPRSPREILDVFIQAAQGLHAAHEAELVHRDFKPDNVLVGHDGRIRVVDFGLARPVGDVLPSSLADLGDAIPIERATLTQTGLLLGTPAYMSPEQLLGHAVGPAGDQFSFCVSLYEALTGTRPFVGDSLYSLIDAVATGSREGIRPAGDLDVSATIVRGLARDAADRHPSMQVLADALAGRESQPTRLRGKLVAAAVALGLSAIGAGAMMMPQSEAVADAAAPAAEPVTLELVTAIAEPVIVRPWGSDERLTRFSRKGKLTLPASATPYPLEISAPGFVTVQLTVVPDRDKSYRVDLRPAAGWMEAGERRIAKGSIAIQAQAETAHERGTKAFTAQRYAEAAQQFDLAAHFLQAAPADWGPRAHLDYNRALAHARAGEKEYQVNSIRVAFELQRRLLELEHRDLEYDPSLATLLGDRLLGVADLSTKSDTRFALVNVSEPELDGTQVFIEDNEACTAPCTLAVEVDQPHRIRFHRPGYQRVELTWAPKAHITSFPWSNLRWRSLPKAKPSIFIVDSPDAISCHDYCESREGVCVEKACEGSTGVVLTDPFEPKAADRPDAPMTCDAQVPASKDRGWGVQIGCCCAAP